MRKQLFAVAIFAQNPLKNPNSLKPVISGSVIDIIVWIKDDTSPADMEALAKGAAKQDALKLFPPNEGWVEHQAFFHVITDDRIAEYQAI